MVRALLDTNIVILHLSKRERLSFNDFEVAVSTVTRFELLRYPGLSASEEESIRSFLSVCVQLDVTTEVADRAALLGRKHRIGMADLLLAATALEELLLLVTKNTKDFRSIPDLSIRDHL